MSICGQFIELYLYKSCTAVYLYKSCTAVFFIKCFFIIAAMGKFMKSGKVVLVLGGRFAGRKAIIVKVMSLFTVRQKNFHYMHCANCR